MSSPKTLITQPTKSLIQTNPPSPYVHFATSDNTRKAYRSDMAHYESWGGMLPANAPMIVSYLEAHATQLNARTLARRLIAIRHWHTYQGFADPTATPLVQKTLIGIKRIHGKPKVKATPLTLEHIKAIHQALSQQTSLEALRDNALIQLGFFGAFRRSELVNIQHIHCRFDPKGLEILLPQSKTDQTHEGQFVVIPYGNAALCPVTTLKTWLEESRLREGYLFRRLNHQGECLSTPISAGSVNRILKKHAGFLNLDENTSLSSHSLRRGLATSAARAGAPIQAIMRAGRWKQTNTVMEYIEASERFNDNAAAIVLHQE